MAANTNISMYILCMKLITLTSLLLYKAIGPIQTQLLALLSFYLKHHYNSQKQGYELVLTRISRMPLSSCRLHSSCK